SPGSTTGDNAIAVFSRDDSTGDLSPLQVISDGTGGANYLDGAFSVSVSPDDKFVYAVARDNDKAITVFKREANGTLTFVETLRDGSGVPDGLSSPYHVAVSPDGKHAYAITTGDDTFLVFSRNETTGQLTLEDTFQDSSIGSPIAGAKVISGLNDGRFLAISPDSNDIYTAASASNSVVHFRRSSLSAFHGDQNGTWTLNVEDNSGDGDGGTINHFLAVPRYVISDVALLSVTNWDNDRDMIEVNYRITGGDSPSFDLGIYASTDPFFNINSDSKTSTVSVTDTSCVAAGNCLGVGDHTVKVNADKFPDPSFKASEPLYSIAVVDPEYNVDDYDRYNNQAILSGVTLTPDGSLHVAGNLFTSNRVDITEGTPSTVEFRYSGTVPEAGRKSVFKIDLPETREDFFEGSTIKFTSGSNLNETRTIDAYDGGTRSVTVSAGLPNVVSANDQFTITTTVDYTASSVNDIFFTGSTKADTIDADGVVENILAFLGNGDDTYIGGAATDAVQGGAGHDNLMGQAGNDRLFGMKGNDSVDGGAGVDTVGVGEGGTTTGATQSLVGGDGGDFLLVSGTSYNDRVMVWEAASGKLEVIVSSPANVAYTSSPTGGSLAPTKTQTVTITWDAIDRLLVNSSFGDDYIVLENPAEGTRVDLNSILIGGPGDDIIFDGLGVDRLFGDSGYTAQPGDGIDELYSTDAKRGEGGDSTKGQAVADADVLIGPNASDGFFSTVGFGGGDDIRIIETWLVDDADTDTSQPRFYQESDGGWVDRKNNSNPGYLANQRARAVGTNPVSTATFSLTDVPPGWWEVFATWDPENGASTQTPYAITDGSDERITVQVRQNTDPRDTAPYGEAFDGAKWERLAVLDDRSRNLATSFPVVNGQLDITVSNDTGNAVVLADAVRVKAASEWFIDNSDRQVESPYEYYYEASAQITSNAFPFPAGGPVNTFDTDLQNPTGFHNGDIIRFASGVGTGQFRTVQYNSSSFLVLTEEISKFVVGSDFAVFKPVGAGNNKVTTAETAPVTSLKTDLAEESNDFYYDYLIRIEEPGSNNGEIRSITRYDSATRTITLNEPLNNPVSVDDALTLWKSSWANGSGTALTGTPSEVGYEGNYRVHDAGGTGSSRAVWTLESLPPGRYEVFATWETQHLAKTPSPAVTYNIFNHAIDASPLFNEPFDADPLTTASVNQQNGPSGDTDGTGRPWQSLGTFDIDTGVIRVEAGDSGGTTSQFVSADAIRVVLLEVGPQRDDWIAQGPAPIVLGGVENVPVDNQVSGALHTVAAHPTDADILYAASVNGGIWKTNDATSARPTWTPLTDSQESLSIGALEFDPTDGTHQTLVAGIGRFSSWREVLPATSMLESVGGAFTGIVGSTDGGATWNNPGSAGIQGENVSGVAARGSTIVVASNGFAGSSGGVFRSTNAGGNFALSTTGMPVGTPDVFDMVGDPTSSSRLYAAVEADGIYRSDDTGASWTKITSPVIDAALDGVITNAGNNNTEMAVASTGRLYAAVLINAQPQYIGYTDNPTSASPTWVRMDLPLVINAAATFIADATSATPIVITSAEDDIAITGATTATPIEITSASVHGLQTGAIVRVQGVAGINGANGFFLVTVTSATTFQLDGSSGTGVYTSGTGLFQKLVAHGLKNGDQVRIQGVTGVNGANGNFFVTVTNAQQFELDGSSGSGDGYTPGTGSFQKLVGTSPRQKPGSQGFIHFSIAVDPTTPTTLYVGGDRQDSADAFWSGPNFIGANGFTGNLWRGDTTVAGTGLPQDVPSPQWEHLTDSDSISQIPDGGTANSSAPHADSREIVFDANGNLIEVNDGGIYRRTNPTDNTGDWFSLNGSIEVTEMHDVAYDANSNIIISGNQDNSTTFQSVPGSKIWINLGGGDGGDV
ncbi:MAG: beta-propeller fold lactonase family protein, partial [Pirellulaceae bacterium]